jgi:hypothetical protein
MPLAVRTEARIGPLRVIRKAKCLGISSRHVFTDWHGLEHWNLRVYPLDELPAAIIPNMTRVKAETVSLFLLAFKT